MAVSCKVVVLTQQLAVMSRPTEITLKEPLGRLVVVMGVKSLQLLQQPRTQRIAPLAIM